jgi:hypothetical protein
MTVPGEKSESSVDAPLCAETVAESPPSETPITPSNGFCHFISTLRRLSPSALVFGTALAYQLDMNNKKILP